MVAISGCTIKGDRIKGLYAIVDNTFSRGKPHIELAGEYLVGGCRILQLRMKRTNGGLWNQEAFEVARSIIELKDRFDFTFIVNDYVDVAAEVEADGIHVGANDTSIGDIRERAGSDIIIGYSSHSVEEAIRAEEEGADYVAFGAIYPSKTKGPGHPVQGIDKLEEVVSMLKVPVVAIGGINRENISDVLLTGVASVAMISALTEAEVVSKETEWYVNKFRT